MRPPGGQVARGDGGAGEDGARLVAHDPRERAGRRLGEGRGGGQDQGRRDGERTRARRSMSPPSLPRAGAPGHFERLFERGIWGMVQRGRPSSKRFHGRAASRLGCRQPNGDEEHAAPYRADQVGSFLRPPDLLEAPATPAAADPERLRAARRPPHPARPRPPEGARLRGLHRRRAAPPELHERLHGCRRGLRPGRRGGALLAGGRRQARR